MTTRTYHRHLLEPSGGSGRPSLTACLLAPSLPLPLPAPLRRPWMDRTEGFAYRCLPLVVANQTGWVIASPCKVTATWTGGSRPASLKVDIDDDTGAYTPAVSHFGYGVLTWVVPFVFRTSPGHNLLVRGPSNWPKDGVHPLEGIVEADWLAATFTMNWILTRPGLPVEFARDEPICMVVPQQRGELERFDVQAHQLADDADLAARFDEWQSSRHGFLDDLKRPGSRAAAAGWQRHYTRGTDTRGRRFADHQVRLKLPRFEPRGDKDDHGQRSQTVVESRRRGQLHEITVHQEEATPAIFAAYRKGLFTRDHRPYYPEATAGAPAPTEWGLDLRRPLGESSILQPIALAMVEELHQLGVRQVAGRGYGAFALTGAILALGSGLTAALVREERKAYGFREIIEGAADGAEPLAIVDDVLSSGRSAVKTADLLREEGLWPTVVITVFRFGWLDGRDRLRFRGLTERSLATLNVRAPRPA